ncbi:MAG: hypothetical protein K8T26_01110 [Lentisphaerae bacterium]|nr:hypothetical protein [Lentisphaerota bacterium]
MKRTTISLNGIWTIAFDPANTGKAARWQEHFPAGGQALPVPGVWELVRPNYDGVAWYRRTFTVRPAWLAGVVRLTFGAVHYFSETYLNGRLVGTHEGGGSPFAFDVTQHLVPGENVVTLRVIGPPGDRAIEGFRAGAPLNQSDLPVGKAAWYFNYGGIWQDVALVITPRCYLESIYIKPFPRRRRAQVIATIVNRGPAARYTLDVAVVEDASGRRVRQVRKTVRLKTGVNEVSLPVAFPSVRCWSCDDPFLYRAVATLGTDRLAARFGMREFTIRGGAFVLNGRRITLKGFLHQGLYPRTLIFPADRAMGRRELALIKARGFNFIRAHLRAPDPWWLDLCDELGLLVEAEPGIGWICNSAETERRCWTEIEALLRHDRNHPSIVFWCLLNEAYHFLGFTMPEIKAMTARLAAAGRKLDDTRLLMDTSGGGGNGSADGGALVWLPHVARRAAMTDDHPYCELPLQDASIVKYRTMGRRGVPLLISEFGAPLAPPDYRKVLAAYSPAERRRGLEDYVLYRDFWASLQAGFRRAGLKRAFGSPDAFIAAIDRVRADEMRLVVAAQRCNPALVGTTFCQFADASGEEFGATDFFRRPKQILQGLTDAIQTPLIAPEILPRVQIAGQRSRVRLTLVNENQLGAAYRFDADIFTAAGRRVRRLASGTVRATRHVQTLLVRAIAPELKPGAYVLRATLTAGTARQPFRSAAVAFTVLAAPAPTLRATSVWDPDGAIAPFFARHGVACIPFSNNFRDKRMPVVMDMRRWNALDRWMLFEVHAQVKKIVQTGGVAILINPEPLLLQDFLMDCRLRPARHMRTLGYILKHPIFNGLPAGGVADYVYAGIFPSSFERGEDVRAAGGEVLAGGLSGHMWTRPADYVWGAGVYRLPLGRGELLCCQMRILDDLATNATSQTLLANLADHAASRIKPGLEHLLFSRCIDPLQPADYAPAKSEIRKPGRQERTVLSHLCDDSSRHRQALNNAIPSPGGVPARAGWVPRNTFPARLSRRARNAT